MIFFETPQDSHPQLMHVFLCRELIISDISSENYRSMQPCYQHTEIYHCYADQLNVVRLLNHAIPSCL